MNTSARMRKDCVLDIFVEIGENVSWKFLNSSSSSSKSNVEHYFPLVTMSPKINCLFIVLADLGTTAEFLFFCIPSTGKILWWHDRNDFHS